MANGPVVISDVAVEAGAKELFEFSTGKPWSSAHVDEVAQTMQIVLNILTVAAMADLLAGQ